MTVGVDGVGQRHSFDGVKDGDERPFPDDAVVEVDPALDGEVWCFGLERDFGDSIFDRDDPMPWATAFLPRVAVGVDQPFASGTVELRAMDNRGNAYVVKVSVSAA